MKTPDYWHTAPNALTWRARLLSPLGRIYAALTARRVAQGHSYSAPVPVICIGNLNAGGTGKTPTTIALAQVLLDMGHRPHIVSRGYGGSLSGPVQVTQHHKAAQVGDEPMLMAAFAPTWVAARRAEGVSLAASAGASHVLMDDGFQNPGVRKSLSIVVVDAAKGFGNGLCIPAGPLREPVQIGLERADIVLSIGSNKDQTSFAANWGAALPEDLLHVTASLDPLHTGYDFAGQRCVAFAGIGYPEKFFATLRETGADLVRTVPLSDHQPLTSALMTRLEADALMLGAQLVTTEKDAVRLPHAFRQKVITLPVRLNLHEPQKFTAALTALG